MDKTRNSELFKNSSGLVRVAKKKFGSGRVAGTRQSLLFTVPDFHGEAYKVWDTVSCFLLPPFDYDICRVWYPIDPARNPWMAPGTAPVFSPCGVWGGNPKGCGGVEQDGECPGGGSSMGQDSRDIIWNNTVTTQWVRGGVAEVGSSS